MKINIVVIFFLIDKYVLAIKKISLCFKFVLIKCRITYLKLNNKLNFFIVNIKIVKYYYNFNRIN